MSQRPSTSRYAVEQFPRLDFAHFINRPGDVVSAKYLQSYGKTGGFSIERPLGCAFDPARRQWIVTDDRVIHLFDDREKSRDHKAEYFTGKTVLRQPSAVVVLAPGMAYAVLDRNGIWIYDVRTDAFQPQVTFSHEQYRGLTVLDGCLVSMFQGGPASEIVMFSTAQPNTVAERFPYNVGGQRCAPSFLDCNGESMVVTDLGAGCFTIYRYQRTGYDRLFNREGPYMCAGKGDGQFGTIGGVRLDAVGDMWIGDARYRNLQWLDRYGTFRGKIQFSDDFASVSNFAFDVEQKKMLVCCRRDRKVKLYDLANETATWRGSTSNGRAGGSRSGYYY
ncbi:hypothetical protein AAVH_25805 [Aphelenchoides avenae]|nr:hypothetical protein AAVH_25805 [Aphelenchus avenae]